MKKILIVSITCTICISLVVLIFVEKSKRKFNTSVEFIADRKWRMIYNEPFQEYYFKYYSAPMSIEELKNYRLPLQLGARLIDEFQDPFLNASENLLYVPLFDNEYNKAIGFAVISAGIDRKRNFKHESKMSFDELMDSDMFYNNIQPTKGVYMGDFYDTIFNFKNYLFGKKDLLIEIINCEEFYLNSYRYEMPIEMLWQSSVLNSLKNKINHIFKIEIDYNAQKLEIKLIENAIILSKSDLCIQFILNSDHKHDSLHKTINLVGTLKSIDSNNELIVFENCIINSSNSGPSLPK